jgi:hypothetical protein
VRHLTYGESDLLHHESLQDAIADKEAVMPAETWGAVAAATGMWIIASVCLIGADARASRPDGVLWTAASSEKVASHPTLVRRSWTATRAGVRTAGL